MARCENCIHDKVCDMWAVVGGIPFVNADTCEHFSPAADVVPRAEIERILTKLMKDLSKRQDKCDKEAEKQGWYLETRREYEGESEGLEYCLQKLAELKKKYT